MRRCRNTWILAVALAVGMLTGCSGETYERINLETSASAAGAETAEIHVEDAGVPAEDSGILSEEPEAVLPEPTRLLFGGDVLLSGHVLSAYEKAGGISGVLDEEYRRAIAESDFFFVNEEFPFSDRGVQAADKEYTFRLPPAKVNILREMGIDGVSLANNHTLDFGEEALLDSCMTLDEVGIMHTGAGADLESASQPVRFEQHGRRIAILGATRVIPEWSWTAGENHGGLLATYDAAAVLQEIRELKETEDYVIVYVHWGIEKEDQPQDYQRLLGQQYIDAGADLVIGSHPHVLQGIEYYKGKPIVYSLGNFVFGSTIPRTMLLEVTLNPQAPLSGEQEGETLLLRVIPGTSGAGYTRVLTDEGKLQEFYQYLQSISFQVTYGADGSVVPAAAQP